MNVLILTCRSRLLLSFCAALILCLLLVSAPQSYSQWDSTDLPLCEAYRRRDSWASPGSSCSSNQGDREDVEGPPTQETNPQHHLNGHGASSIEKPWGGKWTLTVTLVFAMSHLADCFVFWTKGFALRISAELTVLIRREMEFRQSDSFLVFSVLK